MKRRDLLAGILGVPAALASCARRETVPLPPGELAFRPEILGHRLRDGGPLPVIPPERARRVKVAIVGGGMAGLAAAWRLQRAGVDDFVLLELDSATGGTSRSGANEVSAYPWGAHYVTVPMRENRAFVTLLREMGVVTGADAAGDPVVGEEFLCREPEERLFYRGRWYEGLWLHAGATAEDTRQKSAFDAEIARLAAWRDKSGRRAFAIPIASGTSDAEITSLDAVSMAAWMDGRGFTSTRLRWLVDYGCRDDYGRRLDQTSAWAALFYFAARLRAPGAASQEIVTWPEGNGRIAAHLTRSVAGRVRTGLVVADIAPKDGGVDLIALGATPQEACSFSAERVIVAAPRFSAVRAIRPWRDAPPAFASSFQYAPWAVANLTLRDRPAGEGYPLSWDNVLYDSPALGYVVATHQRGIDRGATVLTWYCPLSDETPVAGRKRLFETDRDGWAEAALADLSRAHPDLRRLTTRVDVARWGHAMVAPVPGFVWSAARRAAAAPFRSIHFAHTDLSGLAIFEEAFDHGIRAAEEVLAAFDRKDATLR